MEKRTINDQLSIPITSSAYSNLEGTERANCVTTYCGKIPKLTDAKYTVTVNNGMSSSQQQNAVVYDIDYRNYISCVAKKQPYCAQLKKLSTLASSTTASSDPRGTSPNEKVLIDHFANNGGSSTGTTTGMSTGAKIGIGVGAVALVGFGIWFFGFRKKG